ncbi:MAG: Rap1a/Tai family immunity protein [Betaproteobacteria bacterium]|nr:Rap1a/Tai family immunity protein [Betaproteobacteria bacterium]
MARRAAGIGFVLALLASAPAAAMSGAELLANCAEVIKRADGAPVDAYKAGQCMGYLQGFGEGVKVSALGASSDRQEYEKRRFFCVPEGVTNLQVVRVVVKALREQSQERLQQEAGVLVGLALRRAYPCGPGPSESR